MRNAAFIQAEKSFCQAFECKLVAISSIFVYENYIELYIANFELSFDTLRM